MLRINDLKLPIKYTEKDIRTAVKKKLGIGDYDILSVSVIKDSVDAHRRSAVCRSVCAAVKLRGEQRFSGIGGVMPYRKYEYEYPPASRLEKRPVVVGAGPCGLFAALVLASCGARPVILERGLTVDMRVEKVNAFFTERQLDTECNIQFGEGGAGAFSDGKLNTGIKDGRIRKVLDEFVGCGAPEEILRDGKPHIGTDRLRGVITNLRKKIISLGGEFLFSCRLDDIIIEKGAVRAVKTTSGIIETNALVLAIGHSARDTFEMLHRRGLSMERKSFSVGVRIEHPQSFINDALYHKFAPLLPPADYKAAVHLPGGRGVYTFCMCPGGSVVAAASEQCSVVTNGMSNLARDGKNANSAVLVSILPTDFGGDDVFAGMHFQRRLEKAAFFMGGADYSAPVQAVADFLRGQKTMSLGKVEPTYPIGIRFSQIGKLFPDFVTDALRSGLLGLDRKIRGFAMDDAVLTAVESRSSSPIRILRGEDMQSSVRGIYPCGEGAGYAGGIMSAAVDGLRAAEAVLGKPR